MLHVNDALHQRAGLKDRLMALAGPNFNKPLNETEQKEFDALSSQLKTINEKLDEHAAGAHAPGQAPPPRRNWDAAPGLPPVTLFAPGERGREDRTLPGFTGPSFPDVAAFINTGEGGIMSSLSEGGNLQYTVPGWEVQQFVAAYPTNAPFTEAGATEFETPDAHQINVPIIVTGAAPSVYAEESGPTNAQDAGVYVAKLNADKRAFLTKITEEAVQDIATLESTLVAEGVRRVYRAVSDAVTDALVTSLTAASAIVTASGDYLDDLLSMEAAIDPTWAAQTNCFMMDQSSLSRLRNTRDLQNRPIFDPTSKTLLGYRVVINQRLRGKVLFGAFRPGVYIRQTPLIVLRLLELYSESGKIGIRFQRRSDQAFFSDAATAAQAPQPLFMLSTDVGS